MKGDTRIFQIGFNRCGTKTIHGYLQVNGVRSVHYDNGKLAQRMFRNLRQGKDILSGYKHYQAFFDMEWVGPDELLEGYKLYPELAECYPEAVFILNTRDREAWIKSRLSHNRGSYAERHKAVLGLSSNQDLAEHWREEWDKHHLEVTEFFSARPLRFSVCNIETDLPDLLGRMLPELHPNPILYHVQGKTALSNKAEIASIMHRNYVARLRNERGFIVALTAAIGRLHFGLKWLRDYVGYQFSRFTNAPERALRKQRSADRHFKIVIQGFKGLSGSYVTGDRTRGKL